MSAVAEAASLPVSRPHFDHKPNAVTVAVFLTLLVLGLGYTIWNLVSDIDGTGARVTTWVPFFLLGLALLIALGFEFVNGFHDTANAVATVIYTHSLPANAAVLYSGALNFLGVLFSSGTVAFGVISLLPVELILQVGSGAGFAMVFALLIAAILWNLGTWFLGLPASSSHTLIGSIIGVGVTNALMHGRSGTSGVDWEQAAKVGTTLLVSPVFGFVLAALLLLALKKFVKNEDLYKAPAGDTPPPAWIRGLLILTCGSVSFAHGSNDGQKGMGLIMLILIGTVPMAYALNRAMPTDKMTPFVAMATTTQASLSRYATGPVPADPRKTLSDYLASHEWNERVVPALAGITARIAEQVRSSGTFAKMPGAEAANVRNDMYLASEATRLLGQDSHSAVFDADTKKNLASFKSEIDDATKFIPLWVKVAVAIALGLGTMVGWKRIVVTIGEKIGKTHLTYAQGASAEIVAASTITAADLFGLPVSTTHVLSSGVAGTMAANRSGLQWSTLRNLALAWVLTLPAAMLLAGTLYWSLSGIFAAH